MQKISQRENENESIMDHMIFVESVSNDLNDIHVEGDQTPSVLVNDTYQHSKALVPSHPSITSWCPFESNSIQLFVRKKGGEE